MGRRKRAVKRRITPDPVYHDQLAAKFISRLMKDGKKSVAESILYDAFDLMKEQKIPKEPLDIFKRAVDNVKPVVEVRSRRVGGATYQVPVEVRIGRRQSLAIRWLIQYAANRGGKSMKENLCNEL